MVKRARSPARRHPRCVSAGQPLAGALRVFGDEIESLRTFDPHTQLTRHKIEQVTLSPGGELGILKQQLADDAKYPTDRLAGHLAGEPVYVFIEPGES